MPPLNPFLRAFFRSALPAQCLPHAHHVLLVPTTDVLLHSRDRETSLLMADLASTEDFLASHVVRVPGGVPPGGGAGPMNVRESKAKARQYSTINGRTVVVKDAFVYSNKGFKRLNQAQLLQDAIYYPDVLDGQQWLVYYISRPLVGSFVPAPVVPAVISDEPSRERRRALAEASGDAGEGSSSGNAAPPVPPKKKDIKNFGELMVQFPMISRQMQGGLEKIIRDFMAKNETPITKRTGAATATLARRSSVSSQASTPSLADSIPSIKSSLSGTSASAMVHPTSLSLEPEEESLRTSLESAITSAIDLFQTVDKNQLSLLGANTELTGPVVERMIERYVCEQVHDQTVFPQVCAVRKPDDHDLEAKMRKMADIDIAQVGIPIEGGMDGKRELAARLAKGVVEFRRMGVAGSAQEMLEILLRTQKIVTEVGNPQDSGEEGEGGGEKPSAALTINADVLVSMLLVVVIRSGVRHLHSRLLYMRYFIFIDEVESGEQGYALATLEAVLAHLTSASAGLRMASKRNRLLWQAVKGGDVQELEDIFQPSLYLENERAMAESPTGIEQGSDASDIEGSFDQTVQDGAPTESQRADFVAVNGSLEHVFPFERPPTPPPEQLQAKAKKRVSMASLPRSQSASSGYSSRSHSRHKSVDSVTSTGTSGDLSTERLAQTQDSDGNSVLMMAVDAGQARVLKLLLAMPAHFRAEFVLDDINSESATLLNAAVQTGNRAVTDELIAYIEHRTTEEELISYLARQDAKGRCMAHYLFTQPHLIRRFGKKLPWRLKDRNGQSPLFALCRSYDHDEYHAMVDAALALATATQDDGEPLHLDDHVDAKGNTLLHIVNDAKIALKLLRHCDADVNAANDKRFTPLMVGSKYGRVDFVRALFGDPRTDMTMKDIRGLTAVELAKDDDVRNRIDDLVLLASPPGNDGRTTTVVRSFFVEDATIRFVLKSGAPNDNGTVTVTTCRRSVADFENLARWLNTECPASWLPQYFNLPSPFLIPSKPSRAILRDVLLRLDNFFRNLLTHGTFAHHELVWEFFLVPELDAALLTERSRRKAAARVDNVRDDFEPVADTREVENFVAFAGDQLRGVLHAARRAVRATNRLRMLNADIAEATSLASADLNSLVALPVPHSRAFERYAKTLVPSEAAPLHGFYYALHSVVMSGTAIQAALDRPSYLIGSMEACAATVAKARAAIARGGSNRWVPSGLFEDAKAKAEAEAREKGDKARREWEGLGCELRYTQQTVASELAGWQEEHVRQGRAMCRRLARDMVVRERARLEGMRRALREVRKVEQQRAV